MSQSPFYHYHSLFDPVGLVRKYAVGALTAHLGYQTNFMGVRVDPRYLPEVLGSRVGELEGLPIPANWHADLAEWGAALRAVDIAPGPDFVMAELGCGWGCWMTNTGVAAKKRGLRVKLMGIEGDAGHCEFARECLLTNNFEDAEFSVTRGVAAAQCGQALFPKQDRPGVAWGLEPVFGASAEQVHRATAGGSFDVLPMIPLAELFSDVSRVDLLHVDIQGGEGDLLDGTRAVLDEKVAYIVVGTHSRQLEGRIMTTMLQAGWILEMERPAVLALNARGEPRIEVDGVQGWCNPRLHPATQTKTALVHRLGGIWSGVCSAIRRKRGGE